MTRRETSSSTVFTAYVYFRIMSIAEIMRKLEIIDPLYRINSLRLYNTGQQTHKEIIAGITVSNNENHYSFN